MRSEIHLLMQYTDDFDPAIGYLAVENKMRSASVFPVSGPHRSGVLSDIWIL
jgi:hypothetical protein